MRFAIGTFFLLACCTGDLRAGAVGYYEVADGVQSLTLMNPAAFLNGDPADPKLVVRRLKTGSIPFSGYSFSFEALTGSGFFDYYNANDIGLKEVSLNITPGGPSSATDTIFDCGVESDFSFLPFSNCRFSQFGTDTLSTAITFFGSPGLPAHSHFAIELQGFPAGASVEVKTQATPEPETLVFLLTGVLCLATGGWLRKSYAR